MKRACDLPSLGNTKGKKLEENWDSESSSSDDEDEEITVESLSREIHDLRLMLDKEDRQIRKIAEHQRKVIQYQRKKRILMFQYLGLQPPPELVLNDDDDDLHSDITSDEVEEEVVEVDSNDSTISLESCSQCIRDLELKSDRIISKRWKLQQDDWRKALAYMRERDSIIYQHLRYRCC